jgi:hypothetical protein
VQNEPNFISVLQHLTRDKFSPGDENGCGPGSSYESEPNLPEGPLARTCTIRLNSSMRTAVATIPIKILDAGRGSAPNRHDAPHNHEMKRETASGVSAAGRMFA